MKKKRTVILIVILLLALSVILFACDNTPKTYTLTYHAGTGGSIAGEVSQTVDKGGDGQTVTAVADTGYRFVKWSDDVTTTIRTDTNVTENITVTAEFVKLITLEYSAGEGGSIDGTLNQTVDYGAYAQTVTAVPHEGYRFVKWSDNKTMTARTDTATTNINVTAVFEKIVNTYTYVYNNTTDYYAAENNTVKNVVVSYENLEQASFVIPIREHFTFGGWYLDKDFETQVTDGQGSLVIDRSIFNNSSRQLHAKWIVEEVITYKILMVFVTEAKATLQSNYKRREGDANTTYDFGIPYDIEVNYKMTETERKICEMIPSWVERYLNEMMEGVIVFEVDSYFTTEKLGKDAFNQGDNVGKWSYEIWAYDIPEVGRILGEYRSVMTTFCMNDYNSLLHTVGGTAGNKYGFVHLEDLIGSHVRMGYSLEGLLDTVKTFGEWNSMMDLYLHEFTHTVESQGDYYDYHDILRDYTDINGAIDFDFEVIKPYLLNRLNIYGERKGIPFSFWKGEIDIKVEYQVALNGLPHNSGNIFLYKPGKLIGSGESFNYGLNLWQTIRYGNDAYEVTAIANEGYRFVGWSDGVMTATRQDTNIISYLTVWAIFEEI